MPDNTIVQSDSRTDRDPLPHLIIGSTSTSLVVASLAYILTITRADLFHVFWASTTLATFMFVIMAIKMVSTRWAHQWVAMFITAGGTLSGICYTGTKLFGDPWWVGGIIGTLMCSFLTFLFTDLDDRVNFWAIIAAVLIPGSIIAITFTYLQTIA